MKKCIIQFIIGVLLYLLIPFVSSNPNNSDIIKYLVGAIPVFYSLALFIYYKPKNYLKFLKFNSRNKDIGYQYKISLKNYEMTKVNFNTIKLLLFNMENNEVLKREMYRENYGKHKYKAVFNNGLFVFDIDYSIDEKIFLFECKTTSTYYKLIKRLFKINEKLLQNLNAAKYDITMYLEFLEENNKSQDNGSRNPFVDNIFKEFSSKKMIFSYIAKNGTEINLSNNKISFKSDNLNSINSDIKKEITLFSKL